MGRTDEFADIRGRCGDEDYQNLMDFISAVLPAFPAIDSKRVAVCGGSYGGFMVNWIIGHTSQFVCAVSQRSIANFMTIYGLSDFGYYFVRDQLAAEPLSEAGQAAIHQQSPIRYVGNVQTPTLFLHSDQDWRCPLSEGLQMFTALTDLGVKTRMVCFFKGRIMNSAAAGNLRPGSAVYLRSKAGWISGVISSERIKNEIKRLKSQPIIRMNDTI